ncbi:MAG: hypothetical protein ABIQ40_03245 [Bacteroidia bacterium]
MYRSHPTQLLQVITETKDAEEAEIAFQEFRLLIEPRFSKPFYAVCWKFFTADQNSVFVEHVYSKVFDSMYQDLRGKKFVMGAYESEDEAVVHVMKWMLGKIRHIGLKELEKNKKAEAILRAAFLDLTDEEWEVRETRFVRVEAALPKLSAKDQDILKVYYLTTDLPSFEVRESLIRKYRIPSTNAFSRAKSEAIGRLRKLLNHPLKKKGVTAKRTKLKKT